MNYYTRQRIQSICHSLSFLIKAKVYGVEVGKKPNISGKFVILKYPGSTIEIGHSFVCRSVEACYRSCGMARIKTFAPKARVSIGNHVEMIGTSLTCRSTFIMIGDNSKIESNCIIVDSDFHFTDPARRTDFNEEEDDGVKIGRNVLIGMRCIVLKGVTIGDNTSVGAGSIVTNDLEPDSVYAGNPARFVGNVVRSQKNVI